MNRKHLYVFAFFLANSILAMDVPKVTTDIADDWMMIGDLLQTTAPGKEELEQNQEPEQSQEHLYIIATEDALSREDYQMVQLLIEHRTAGLRITLRETAQGALEYEFSMPAQAQSSPVKDNATSSANNNAAK